MGLVVSVVVGVVTLPLASAQRPKRKQKTFAADKGPSKVDVSRFPKEIQAGYKIFAGKCSQCHTLARPINTDFPPRGWKAYVKRMMGKPNAAISPTQGREIYRFLKYYQLWKDYQRAKKRAR